ncbi:flavin prenyltransferase UbiX [Aliagarivorans marinus]|uniref:flavin prenyltransferase UbiX n=1 Tax=Aliagarivorans marinus TaxID=561965 RepID=UPI000416C593|nr:flavin prenyltransferase UbiX [Aliagarivorans marinus]
MQEITLAITGASGAPYAQRLLESLLITGHKVHLLLSSAAKVVVATELAEPWPNNNDKLRSYLCARFNVDEQQLEIPGKTDWFSKVASGSSSPKQMVICPCSMGTLAAVAHGMSDNLIERAADVVIKEKGQLVLVPREMPFSAIHLENMLKLARLGVDIMPACPGYYHQPESIDDLVDHVVARVMDHLNIEHKLSKRWGYQQ